MAGAMDTMDDKDLEAHFSRVYKQNLLPMIRNLKLLEEVSPSCLVHLQEKKKETKLMQKALEEKQEEFKERMEVVTCRWKELHNKKAELKSYMEKSERILKENKEMQTKAVKKATEEREKKLQKEIELLRANRELKALRIKHQKLSNKVQKYYIFHKYLEAVVKNSEFEDIEEILLHYETLVRMRKDLWQSQQQCKEMSDQGNVLLDQYKAEKDVEILHYKKELQELQLHFEQAQSDVHLWEGHWADVQTTNAKKAQLLAMIKMAICSLFQTVSTQLKANLKLLRDDSHRQLDMIQQFIQDHTDLLLEVKRIEMQNCQRASLTTEI
ncbi:coiled-coil domain-containing protein 42 [Apus apus]|uniref:coiled-coil domain-containing protein 42 n=1 Tax=Apus apus TaxID=8895 RepID=UPI0021F8DD65|nr:coiled-coil domain-containing protein 42 [Apus apus]